MNQELARLLDTQGGVVTKGQALTVLSRRELEADLKCDVLEKLWHGIYGSGDVDTGLRLRGLDLATGTTVAVCLSTAAGGYGFDTEDTRDLHVLDPGDHHLRPADGLVAVRQLLPLAVPEAESPMESEARLVMIDGGLPTPALQYEIVDNGRQVWRVDFAWPEYRVAAEYDGVDWHSGPEAFFRDRRRTAALQELDWVAVPIVAEDVRRRPWELVRRIEVQLQRARAA